MARKISGYALNEGSNNLVISNLRFGDLNGDNAVNLLDLSLLSSSYGVSASHPLFKPLADSNCDGIVNIVDISIFSASFGMVGDNPGP